jgi:hypothetical protein
LPSCSAKVTLDRALDEFVDEVIGLFESQPDAHQILVVATLNTADPHRN